MDQLVNIELAKIQLTESLFELLNKHSYDDFFAAFRLAVKMKRNLKRASSETVEPKDSRVEDAVLKNLEKIQHIESEY